MTFGSPFALTGIEKCLPAGTYDVATEEEQIDGVSFPAYRRLLSCILRRTPPGTPGNSQSIVVDLDELEMAYGQERKMNQQDQ